MCGIVALAAGAGAGRNSGPAITRQLLERGLAGLESRGPDGRDVYLPAGSRVGLGHALLRIQDPLCDPQPLVDQGRGLAATVNGEFYDHVRQRRRLGMPPGRLDSEILLPLYARYGKDCIAHLRGEFAFVLHDADRDLILAARDRFGVKPLCYAVHRERLYIASAAKALFAMGLPCRWDHESLFHAFAHQYLPSERTLFAGVKQLRPGEILLFQNGRLRLEQAWDLDYVAAGDPDPPRTKQALPSEAFRDEAAREVRDRLRRAVRMRMSAPVSPVCHLSGGLDSSAILALAAEGGQPPPCFSIRFREPGARRGPAGFDEGDQAASFARRLGAPLHFVDVSQADILEHLSDAVYQAEGLAINGQLSAKYLLNRAIHRTGHRVALSGEGADETFAGYAHLQLDFARGFQSDDDAMAARVRAAFLRRDPSQSGVMLPLVDSGDPLIAAGDGRPLETVRRRLGFVPAWLETKVALGARMFAVLDADFQNEARGYPVFERLLDGFDHTGQLAGRHPVDRSAYLWSRLALSGYILRTLGDGMEMAFAVEGRPPFLDHELFEYVRGLPVEERIAGKPGELEKGLLRRALANDLPPEVLKRPKHPLLAPPLTRFASKKVRERMRAMLAGESIHSTPFLDRGRLLAAFDSLGSCGETARAAMAPVFMMALCAGEIQRHFAPGA